MFQKNNFFNHSPFSLPHTLSLNNNEYEVRTSFKNWIKLILLYSDKIIDNEMKIPLVFQLVFCDYEKVLNDLQEEKIKIEDVFKGINYFLNCGLQSEEKSNHKKIYDFKQDWDYIYSAFMQQYKIDLNEKPIHWFDFIKLFKGLSQDTEFVKIIGYRTVDINKLPKEQKQYYRKMKEKYKLQDEYETETCLMEEDGNEILRKLSKGG